MLTEARLVNWGKWSRGGFSKPSGASPLYRLIVENTSPEELQVAAASSEPKGEVDETDAVFVDRLICNAGLYPYQIDMLKGKYIYQWSDRDICRKCRIYQHLLMYEFRKILDKILTYEKKFI